MADAQLTQVRPKFVEKVSKSVVKQLADDLLNLGILNDGEVEEILEENDTRTDKARCLIDSVRRKGPKASGVMITHIEKRDSSLYNELGLSTPPPAPAPQPQAQTDGSKESDCTVEDLWKKMKNDPDVYPVTKESYKKRLALMITNVTFANAKMNRHGAERDQENMERLLKTLGYEVVKHTNLTGKEINEAFIEFSKHPKLKETDSVMVVLMSHGKRGAVLGVNFKSEDEKNPDEFPVDNIYKHLGSENCPALLDKPKVIIIQACRGEDRGSVLVSDSTNEQEPPSPSPFSPADLEDDSWRFVHKEKDFISLLSCTPDTVSYRQTDNGSILIQYIVNVFNGSAKKDNIQELFRKVLSRFESFKIQNKTQMATIDRSTMVKNFFLFPGLEA